MCLYELNLAVDELLGPFERNDQLLHLKANEVSDWTCGEHISHILKMNMSIIDDLIMLACQSDHSYKNNRLSLKGRMTIKLRMLSAYLNDMDYDHLKYLPDDSLVINKYWLRNITEEWETKLSILSDMDSSWAKRIRSTPDPVIGHMTGNNWIKYLTILTYRHISVIHKILSCKKNGDNKLMDYPTKYDNLLNINYVSLN
jgi:hypothetical protein